MALDATELQTIEHDVLVIGAGGAGLRAAIECSAQKLSTGVISKSLLGKAHTVMAEGGMAAAMGNVDARDNWKIHFRDTMRGGKFLNVWRMAELHAKQAPERVRELEEWGAVFDRTKDGLISQRNFGGHRYPRLAHVGDRTGLELIRSLQDHGVHQGISFHMECTALELLKNGERFMFKYIPEKFAAETADTVEEADRWPDDKTARRPPELLTRDEVARSINAEVKAGRGSPHGGVFLDIASRVPADVIKRKL